ncbi:SMI1/KNR4 family protein [Candidatus Riflebacteria bacterium]
MKAINKLLKISSKPIFPISKLPKINFPVCQAFKDLTGILKKKNGFLSHESALFFLPANSVGDVLGLKDWNEDDFWRKHYKLSKDSLIFFAMDVFGCQFGMHVSKIVRFIPETGELIYHSKSFDEWAEKILEDYDYETGWSLAREWQLRNSPLQVGYRLVPKQPFVLGGKCEPENFVAMTAKSVILNYAFLYNQIKDYPDGKKVKIKGWLSL